MENLMVERKGSVFSSKRAKSKEPNSPILKSGNIKVNDTNVLDGLDLLKSIHDKVITASFFDPQYRGIMEKMKYGNEGTRQKERAVLEQMSEELIQEFIEEISRVLQPSGHLLLWIDKFHLCEGTSKWFKNTELSVVDLITWDKGKIGMGYRTRRKSEYLLILQKLPLRAKGVWTKHNIPDVWTEKIVDKKHPHQKPIVLLTSLIASISGESDYILDPCAGSYAVLEACKEINRNFIGSDLKSMKLNGIN
jgi:site-specific DNA-methyltransferase (adenine-specific)